MLYKFQKARRAYQVKTVPFRAVLGNETNNPYAEFGMYWVRRKANADPNDLATTGAPFRVRAGSAIIVPRGGRVVWVERGKDTHLTVTGYDHDDLVAAGIDPRGAQPNDPYREWIRFKQIQNFRALPLATTDGDSMKVQVRQLAYYDGDGNLVLYHGTNAAIHIDLTDYTPADGLQRYVVLWLRTYNPFGLEPIQVTVSTPIDSIDEDLSFEDMQECADQADYDAIPIQSFRLANGQTTLKLVDTVDFDLRQFINMPHVFGFPNPVARHLILRGDRQQLFTGSLTVTGDLTVEGELTGVELMPDAGGGSGGGSGMTSFNIAADTGTTFSVEDGDTATWEGAGGIDAVTDDMTKTVIVDGSGVVPEALSMLQNGYLYNDAGSLASIKHGISITDPTPADNGSQGYTIDSTWLNILDRTFWFCTASSGVTATWTKAVTPASVDTLTGKTIDGDNNTVQDLPLTAIKTNASNTKRFLTRDASGVPTDTTNPPLDNLQHNHTNAAGGGTLDAAAIASGNIAAARINNALLAPGPIGTTTPNSGYFSDLRVSVGGFLGRLTHAITAARTWTFPDATGTVVLETNTATLTGKTIDGDDNTLQDVPLAAIKTVGANTKRLISRDASGVISDAVSPAFDNANHNHQNAAGGGTLDAAAIASGVINSARIPVLPYKIGLPTLRRVDNATMYVSPGVVDVNGTRVEYTTTRSLGMATNADWIGGTSLEAASTPGNVYSDAAGNRLLYDALPNCPTAAAPVFTAQINGSPGLNGTSITYDGDTGEGNLAVGMLLGVYTNSTFTQGRGRGSAAAGSLVNASFALITAISTGGSGGTITVEAGHNINLTDNDYLIAIPYGELIYRQISGTWYRFIGSLFNNASSNLEAAIQAKSALYNLNEGSDISVTSTSMADLSSALDLTILCDGSPVDVRFLTSSRNSGNGVNSFDVSVDAVDYGGDSGLTAQNLGANLTATAGIDVRIPNLLPGTHRFKARGRVSSGTTTIFAGAGTANLDIHSQFAVNVAGS